MQRSTIDFVAISLGMLISLRQAASQLTLHRPPQQLCTIRNFSMLLVSVVAFTLMYYGQMEYLRHQPFFKDAKTLPDKSVSSLAVCAE